MAVFTSPTYSFINRIEGGCPKKRERKNLYVTWATDESIIGIKTCQLSQYFVYYTYIFFKYVFKKINNGNNENSKKVFI